MNLKVKQADVTAIASPLTCTLYSGRSPAHCRVPAKGGLVCKGAVTEATHVGLLSCVDALVPLKRIDLSELFVTFFTVVRTLT